MLPALLLPLSGGILFYWAKTRRRQPSSAKLLDDTPMPEPVTQLDPPKTLLTVEQNLALSIGLLGLTSVGHWAMLPFWQFLSLPGLLYLNLHFVRNAYNEWHAERRVSMATNDAVLATGLLLTRQFMAGSLFATLFFTSCKLQKQAERNLAHYLSVTKPEGDAQVMPIALSEASAPANESPVASPHQPSWQKQIEQGAFPLLTLSAFSIPWLGFNRSLAVLLSNFGYDYRVTAPLSTLTYLKAANEHGILLRDGHVLDQLLQVDVLVLDVADEEQWRAELQTEGALQIVTLTRQTSKAEHSALLAELRNQGHCLAYASDRLDLHDLSISADIVIALQKQSLPTASSSLHIILAQGQPTQLQQLLGLAHSLHTTNKRSFYLALAPGLLNLSGVYFGSFGVMTALLIDYGGMMVGLINAGLPIQSRE